NARGAARDGGGDANADERLQVGAEEEHTVGFAGVDEHVGKDGHGRGAALEKRGDHGGGFVQVISLEYDFHGAGPCCAWFSEHFVTPCVSAGGSGRQGL